MRNDDYPTPVSDPEADGLPDVADDDSTAHDDVLTGRQADGAHPAELPGDNPVAVDRYGNTAQEQADGEPLDYKLGRERPETPVSEVTAEVDPLISDEADGEAASAQAQFDSDVLSDSPTSDPDSPVSLYDHGQLGEVPGRDVVGRLVEPEQGIGTDQDADSIAYDAGAAGGGASAEELAVRETAPPQE
ncbi:DUF5709 domain-containing protein [Melissospora conviva]|uniref:DUF5709 domain-containing protein n=1 Tax=Melissospora conviva TaxID=3388432 RepID=UPI003B7F8BE0